MIQLIFGILTAAFMIILLIQCRLEPKRHTKISTTPTFFVPFYNDGISIIKTLESIYREVERPEVFVIDDASNSENKVFLENIQKEYGFELIRNEKNIGKVRSLNLNLNRSSSELILFIDSDTILNSKAYDDVMCRMSKRSVAAVSCPYTPKEKGIFALMQTFEYYLYTFVIGSSNFPTSLTIWGGFVCVKKKAILLVGGFSETAINEDLDLASRLVEAGWIVQQSLIQVKSGVPTTLRGWMKQKLRWNGGAVEWSQKYSHLWKKNPLPVIFNMFLSFFGISLLLILIFEVINLQLSLSTVGSFAIILFIAILPPVFGFKDSYTPKHLLLAIPFVIFYVPLLSFNSTLAGILLPSKLARIKRTKRGW